MANTDPDAIIYGPTTIWFGPRDLDLGHPADDERWELLHPRVPDDPGELVDADD